jgi:SAM-dependent methyltransferase
MQRARESARTLWGTVPAGTGLVTVPWGSPEFYQEMRRTRYREQPWHPALLENNGGQRLLEIGCGAGTDLAYLGRRFDTVVGIDLTETGARLAGGALVHWDVDGSTILGDGEALPFKDASFDLVYSFGVLHHTDHPDRALAEIHRVLRPGGRVIVGLYHRWSLFTAEKLLRYLVGGRFLNETWNDFMARCEQGAMEYNVRPRLQLYSRRGARRLLTGFCDIRIRTFHAAGFGISSQGMIGRLAGTAWGWYVVVEGVR